MPAGKAFCQNTPKKIGITNKGHAGPVHTSGRTRALDGFCQIPSKGPGKSQSVSSHRNWQKAKRHMVCLCEQASRWPLSAGKNRKDVPCPFARPHASPYVHTQGETLTKSGGPCLLPGGAPEPCGRSYRTFFSGSRAPFSCGASSADTFSA